MSIHPASFRDPAGYLYEEHGTLLRRVTAPATADLRLLHDSGLYDELASDGLLVPHRVVENTELDITMPATLQPERIPFVSHPYEWTFGQLKDAALLTLDLQRRALRRGMSLKDASAFNVQFRGSRPVFIDTLSFEPYVEGIPWPAYRQFCEHFVVPLALATSDTRLLRVAGEFPDGVPLDLGARLLRPRTLFRPGLLLHVHLHARAVGRAARIGTRGSIAASAARARVSRAGLEGMLASLKATVGALHCRAQGRWRSYDKQHGYADSALEAKRRLVHEFLGSARASVALDLGANTGEYSAVIRRNADYVVSVDADHGAADEHYRRLKERSETAILPLVVDLLSPAGNGGWRNRERAAFSERASGQVVVALALVHHLVLSGHVPLDSVAEYFATLAPTLLIEFVAPEDAQVRELLAHRRDTRGVHPYSREAFERAFARHFRTQRSQRIEGTDRVLYLMTRASA